LDKGGVMKKKLLSLIFVLLFCFAGCQEWKPISTETPDWQATFYVKPEKISEIVDGNLVEGLLLKPRRSNGKGIIYGHGGFASLAPWQEFPEAQIFCLIGGYYVFILDYEGKSDISKQSPLQDIAEVRDSVTLLKRKTGITGDIYGVGTSRGGYVVVRFFVDYPLLFKKVINFMGPINMVGYDWSVWGAQSPQHQQMVEQAKAYFAKTLDPYQLAKQGKYKGIEKRMLFLYGEKDPLCPPGRMVIPFVRETGTPFVIFKDASHNVHRLSDAQGLALIWMAK